MPGRRRTGGAMSRGILRRLLDRAGSARIRYWRERSRLVVAAGFGIYAVGFFIDWTFGAAWSAVLTFAGGGIVAIGAATALLWFVDADDA